MPLLKDAIKAAQANNHLGTRITGRTVTVQDEDPGMIFGAMSKIVASSKKARTRQDKLDISRDFYAVYAAEFRESKVERRHFLKTLGYSLLIEVVGIVHIYIAMLTLHLSPSWMIAMLSYIVAVVFLIISPFLRGLGAVEASMSFILIKLGYPPAVAVSITLIYKISQL